MKYSYPNSKDNENENKQPNCQIQYDTSDVLTLEGLRRTYNSCSDCGVCWYDDHVNLDCSECGGYAMCRPCIKCNGQCGAMWKRDATASHLNKKAVWVGSCSLDFQWNSTSILDSSTLSGEDNQNANNLENSYLHISPKSKAYA